MKASEAGRLLSYASAFEPGLIVTDEAAVVWGDLLGDVAYADAMAAVRRHYRESRYPIRPADVVQGVRDIRRQRVREVGDPSPPPDELEEGASHLWLKAFRRAAGDGMGRAEAEAEADRACGVTRRELGPPVRRLELPESGRGMGRPRMGQGGSGGG